MGKLENYKSKAPAITGISTINHGIRVKLGLSCSEYVFLDHLARRQEKNEQTDSLTVFINTGFSPENQKTIIKSLLDKKYLDFVKDKYQVTSKWFEGMDNIERDFELTMWTKDGRVTWTGAKKKALQCYESLRKKGFTKEHLQKQRDLYFEYLELVHKSGFNRDRMMCQVFLNPATERFAEDYERYIKEIRVKLNIDVNSDKKAKPITKEVYASAYGKDYNK